MALQKAFLMSKPKGSPQRKVEFQFNPASFSYSKTASFIAEDENATSNSARQTFMAGRSITFSLTALFDGTGVGSEAPDFYILKLKKFMLKEKKAASPDPLTFHWGRYRSPLVQMNQLSVNYTYFAPDGVPLRASVEMSFIEQRDELPPTNPTSGTPNPGSVHRVESGQFLDTIADDLYDNPSRWRQIAEANNIDDPLAIRPGRYLLIPELEV